MSKYRFHLQKYSLGSKIACPSCERPRCFVKYVDEEGVVSFPMRLGNVTMKSVVVIITLHVISFVIIPMQTSRKNGLVIMYSL